jgi:hypothetical protein
VVAACFIAWATAAAPPPPVSAVRPSSVQRCKKWQLVNVRGFGWEVAHAAVSRRPPVSLYTYAASVWDLSIV